MIFVILIDNSRNELFKDNQIQFQFFVFTII
jgi:hypothetical protein